jgi:hypothetical protein
MAALNKETKWLMQFWQNILQCDFGKFIMQGKPGTSNQGTSNRQWWREV